jgi:hypothetical protein
MSSQFLDQPFNAVYGAYGTQSIRQGYRHYFGGKRSERFHHSSMRARFLVIHPVAEAGP